MGVGDFYYELAVQAIHICMRDQAQTGGFMLLSSLRQQLQEQRGTKAAPISSNDIELAIRKMKTLGNGFEVIKVGTQKVVQSVPFELSSDDMVAMTLAQQHHGYVTKTLLLQQGWTPDRFRVTVVSSFVHLQSLIIPRKYRLTWKGRPN